MAGSYNYLSTNHSPITAVTIPQTPAAEQSPAPSLPLTLFIGREKEIGWLQNAIQRTMNSQGGFCFIQGESGVGKSRLVDEVLLQMETAVYLFQGRGHEFESMIPYSLLAQALQKTAPTIPWERFIPPPPWLKSLLPILPDLPIHFPGYDLTEQKTAVSHHIIEGLGMVFVPSM